nr:dna oxidative demethylase alkbh2 [Quercus suber]
MSSLLALLSQQSPQLQMRKALMVIGLQNDSISPDGKLPVSVSSGWLDRIKILVNQFRPHGDIIWVRSEYRENRPLRVGGEEDDSIITYVEHTSESNTTDEEHFLTRTTNREAACLPGSWGAAYSDEIIDLIDRPKDLQVVKSHYSAFKATSLLMTLRSKLITELYICGCYTNLSVYATATEAARYGIKITLVEDCLGSRQEARHDLAVQKLVSIMSAKVMISPQVVDALVNPPVDSEVEGTDEEEDSDDFAVSDKEPNRARIINDPQSLSDVDLEVDSDEDENAETVLPAISDIHSRRLALRCSSAERPPSRSSAGSTAKPKDPSSIEASSRASSSLEDVSLRSHEQYRTRRPGFDRRSRENSNRDSIEAALARRSSSHGSRSKPDAIKNAANGKDAGSDGVANHKQQKSREPWLDGLENPSQQSAVPPAVLRALHPGLAGISKMAGLSQATISEYEKMMEKARRERALSDLKRRKQQSEMPLLAEFDEEASAGSRILYNLMPDKDAETILDDLNNEIEWQTMYHQTGEVPRLICCQGTVESDDTVPIYRHPSDQSIAVQDWSPWVNEVRKVAEQAVGHDLNHVLIQLYRSGSDYISEHSDKTLDIAHGSNIVNVSFGAQRTMRMRTKRGAPSASSTRTMTGSQRTTHRIPLPHNSMLTMSLATNAEFLHGINADKRPAAELSEEEKAYKGQRISLTFRKIATFLTPATPVPQPQSKRAGAPRAEHPAWKIFGQGATGKTRNKAQPVLNGVPEESARLIRAFGKENQHSPQNGPFDWDAVYGKGSDVLHLK